MKMRSVLIALVYVLSFFGITFAALEGLGYTDALFFMGSQTGINHLFVSFTGGTTGIFGIQITNPTDTDINVRLDFVDQVLTAEGEGNSACSMIHTTDDFGSHLLWDTGSFLVPANSGVERSFDLNYNYCFSGPSLGCMVQLSVVDPNLGSFDVGLGRANFIDFAISKDATNCNKYTIKMIPSYINSTFESSGYVAFWINDDFVSIYTGNVNNTGNIVFDSGGISQWFYTLPNQGSGYLALLKVRSYLSVGYTGYWDIANSSGLDFTNLINLDAFVYRSGWFNKFFMYGLPESQGFSGEKSLLVPGDVNNNDYIGASDLALINYNLTVNLDPIDGLYDLNKDGYITSKDQAILIQNVMRNGFWRYFKNSLRAGLGTEDDPDPTIGELPRNL